MGVIDTIGIIDYRDKCKRAAWQIGTRARTLYVTVHYNGPRVKAFGYIPGELAQLQFDAIYHMRPNGLAADGIQYHGATLSNGANYQLRNWAARLWHCGNVDGNLYSLSWHLPLGGDQQPTPRQLDGLTLALDAIRAEYGIIAVNVRRHNEWKATDCPGLPLTRFVNGYRVDRSPPKPLAHFRTLVNANVRTAPSVYSPIALNGTAITPAGTVFPVDAIIENGEPFKGVSAYVHRSDGLGFYHLSVVTPVLTKEQTQ